MQPDYPMFDAGLEAFSVADLCHPGPLAEAVIGKLNLLPPGRLAHERLEQGVRLILDIVRDAVCGRFPRLPLTALADFLNALHYFLKWRDRRPDTWDGGYVDDLEVVLQTLARHQPTVTAYREWRLLTGCESSIRYPAAPAGYSPPVLPAETRLG
ncbi:MAG: hypothetical protein HS113_17655 [Verrucomicrobiales bacterium]|nr:hypothetical protein [Verrucomicrobiales bacterium]